MAQTARKSKRRRNRAFEETHGALIDAAVRLVSDKGIESLSLSDVARTAGVNRTTIYYHFDSRDALVAAVRDWSSDQLAAAFAPVGNARERSHFITRFVLEKPEVASLWAEEFLSPGDIRKRYPDFDKMVASFADQLAAEKGAGEIDPEIYTVILLTWAMLAPRVYHNSVRPDLSIEEVVERFTDTQLRLLRRSGTSLGD